MISDANHPMFYQKLNAKFTYHQLELKAWRSDCNSDPIQGTSSPDLDFSIYDLSQPSEEILQEFYRNLLSVSLCPSSSR